MQKVCMFKLKGQNFVLCSLVKAQTTSFKLKHEFRFLCANFLYLLSYSHVFRISHIWPFPSEIFAYKSDFPSWKTIRSCVGKIIYGNNEIALLAFLDENLLLEEKGKVYLGRVVFVSCKVTQVKLIMMRNFLNFSCPT